VLWLNLKLESSLAFHLLTGDENKEQTLFIGGNHNILRFSLSLLNLKGALTVSYLLTHDGVGLSVDDRKLTIQ
jgi:hypothetical protein